MKGNFHVEFRKKLCELFLVTCIFYFIYQAADNFSKIKNILFHLRKSCVLTLARKHNKNKV